MSCNNQIDARGAKANIYIDSGTVLSVTLTFTDGNSDSLNLNQFDDIVFNVETETPTQYKLSDNQMSIQNTNELVTDFEVNISAGKYDYQLWMDNGTGNVQYMYGQFIIS